MTGGLVSVSGTLSRGTHGTINLNSGGTLQIGTGGAGGVLSVSTLTNNGTLIFNRSDASTYSGIVSGTGAVTKQGGGTLNFTGTSSYTAASDRFLNGPNTGPSTGPISAHQKPSLFGSTWLARVIRNFPSSRRSNSSPYTHRTSPPASTAR